MLPDGESMRRSLTVWSETVSDDAKASPLPRAEIDHFRQFYQPSDEHFEGDKHTFVGLFEGEMPGDVGGAGSYERFESQLGSTSLYSERFRGEDDLQASMQKRNEAVDHLVELLHHWAGNEISDPETRERLLVFIDNDLRNDLKNIAAYCWTHAMLSDLDEQQVMQRLVVRVSQYLAERDYVAMQDAPKIFAALNSQDAQQYAEVLHAAMVRKLGLPEGDTIAILGDSERLQSSLRESLRETSLYREELARYRKAHPQSDEDDDVDPLGLLLKYALEATLPRSGSEWGVVKVNLRCGTEPYVTNGSWDDETRSVRWEESIDDANLPALAFAGWSEPNERLQERCFGATVLSGERLAKYVLWYRGLSAAERENWDSFLDDLNPATAPGRIEEFTFPGVEEPSEWPRSLFAEVLSENKQE
ncbi:hypothetical protein [Rhodopirellula sallentina]|uniref:Uncharacterized protein n=1 Tax=Rhodopirellula sallentina SM41 TaxID=1263870 RepID=M5U6P4_9BACT|nr:hypothetical protein [Rhodopirellula sallentina]EMI53546.1 hypothetical protein RSSM_05002 [Rhodopirellula sallentina SM41]